MKRSVQRCAGPFGLAMVCCAVACSCGQHVPDGPKEPVTPVVQAPPVKTNAVQALPTAIELPSVAYTNRVDTRPFVSQMPRPGVSDYVLGMIDPEALSGLQGSYTTDDLQSGTSSSYSLKSQWFMDRPYLPQFRVTVRRENESGDYELGGVQMQLYDSPFSVSYESDADRDEQKTFLQFRRDF